MADTGGAKRPAVGAAVDLRVTLAKSLLAARRTRKAVLPGVSLGEPAWDMLLDLYVAHRESRELPVCNVCVGADVPQTTALRWMTHLATIGYIIREDDPVDRRRTLVRLTADAVNAVDECLDRYIALFESLIPAQQR